MKQYFNKKNILRVTQAATKNKWFGPAMLAVCFMFLLWVRVTVDLPTFGDEPHYLIMDSSLVKDHDLNLYNNYKQKDYASFFSSELGPQGAPPAGQDVRSIHGDGLPFFLLPGFYLGGKWGASLQMVFVATAVVWLTWVWVKQITQSRKLAYISAAALTICYFFSNLAGYIYPDIFLGGIVLAGLIITQKYFAHKTLQFVCGALLGFSILVHFRMLIFVLPIMVLLAYKLWRAERKLPWLAALGFLLFGGIYYYWQTYIAVGSIAPTVGSSSASLHGNVFTNISAMLFDSNKGLLVFNPILLLVIVGLPIWFKQHRESLIITVLALAPTIATTVMFIEWHGGYAPTGRYMMTILPAFIPALAFAISKIRFPWHKTVAWTLATLTLLITLDAARTHYPLIDPNFWTRHRLFDHIEHLTGWTVDKILPAFVNVPYAGNATVLLGDYGPVKLTFCYLGIAALLAYGYYLSRTLHKKRTRQRISV